MHSMPDSLEPQPTSVDLEAALGKLYSQGEPTTSAFDALPDEIEQRLNILGTTCFTQRLKQPPNLALEYDVRLMAARIAALANGALLANGREAYLSWPTPKTTLSGYDTSNFLERVVEFIYPFPRLEFWTVSNGTQVALRIVPEQLVPTFAVQLSHTDSYEWKLPVWMQNGTNWEVREAKDDELARLFSMYLWRDYTDSDIEFNSEEQRRVREIYQALVLKLEDVNDFVGFLLGLLIKPSPELRAVVIRILREVAGLSQRAKQRTSRLLVGLLYEQNEMVPVQAARALGELGTAELYEVLSFVFSRLYGQIAVQKELVNCLSKLVDKNRLIGFVRLWTHTWPAELQESWWEAVADALNRCGLSLYDSSRYQLLERVNNYHYEAALELVESRTVMISLSTVCMAQIKCLLEWGIAAKERKDFGGPGRIVDSYYSLTQHLPDLRVSLELKEYLKKPAPDSPHRRILERRVIWDDGWLQRSEWLSLLVDLFTLEIQFKRRDCSGLLKDLYRLTEAVYLALVETLIGPKGEIEPGGRWKRKLWSRNNPELLNYWQAELDLVPLPPQDNTDKSSDKLAIKNVLTWQACGAFLRVVLAAWDVGRARTDEHSQPETWGDIVQARGWQRDDLIFASDFLFESVLPVIYKRHGEQHRRAAVTIDDLEQASGKPLDRLREHFVSSFRTILKLLIPNNLAAQANWFDAVNADIQFCLRTADELRLAETLKQNEIMYKCTRGIREDQFHPIINLLKLIEPSS